MDGIRRRRARAIVLGWLVATSVIACGPSGLASGSPAASAVVSPSPTGGPATGGPATGAPSSASAGSSASPGASSSAATAAASAPPATAIPPSTTKPTTKPTAAAGGSVSARLCGFLTADEVSEAMGLGALTARAEPGDPGAGACSYLAGDRAVVATAYLVSGASSVLAAHAGQSELVPGLADEAVWVDAIHALYIRKGDSLMEIQLQPTVVPPGEIKPRSVALGSIAAGRLP